jgi:hypothetical protein
MSETRRESIRLLNPALDKLNLSPATLINIYMVGRVSGTRSSISRLYTSRNTRGGYFYYKSPLIAGVTSYKRPGPRYPADLWRRHNYTYNSRLLAISDWR